MVKESLFSNSPGVSTLMLCCSAPVNCVCATATNGSNSRKAVTIQLVKCIKFVALPTCFNSCNSLNSWLKFYFNSSIFHFFLEVIKVFHVLRINVFDVLVLTLVSQFGDEACHILVTVGN